MPADQEAGDFAGECVERALLLLREALQIIDTLGDCPQVGAKLNDVIESLVEESSGS